MGPSWGRLERILARLGVVLGYLRAVLGRLGVSWVVLGPYRGVLGLSCGSLACLGASWAVSGRCGGERSGLFWSFLGRVEAIGVSSSVLGPPEPSRAVVVGLCSCSPVLSGGFWEGLGVVF